MKITYHLERNDVFAFQVYALLRNKTVRVIFFGGILFQAFYAFSDPIRWFLFENGGQWSRQVVSQVFLQATMGFILSSLIVSALILAVNAIALLILTMRFTKGDGTLGQHALELNDEFLTETTDVNITSHAWKSVQRVVNAKKFILIYVSPTNAHIVPKRAFASEMDATRFFIEVERLKANSAEYYSPSYLATAG